MIEFEDDDYIIELKYFSSGDLPLEGREERGDLLFQSYISSKDQKLHIVGRYRLYEDDKTFDSVDSKKWFHMTLREEINLEDADALQGALAEYVTACNKLQESAEHAGMNNKDGIEFYCNGKIALQRMLEADKSWMHFKRIPISRAF